MEHRQPVTMPRRERATVLDDLPEWIIVEEILIRLPAKDLLRCRAVRKCWHSATSTDKFMLDHRRRQPLLPILSHAVDQRNHHLFISPDAGAGQQRLCHVLRSSDYGILQASLDGLLIVAHRSEFFICNPVTRKCAPLGKLQSRLGFHDHIFGFYQHQPSGEYRLLWGSCPTNYIAYGYQTSYYVIAVGSENQRCINRGCIPDPVQLSPSHLELLLGALEHGLPGSSGYPPVHHRGNLHWRLGEYHGCARGYILVFNTSAERFRLMCRPAQLPLQDMWLLEMDGTLALCNITRGKTTIDVWAMQDYDAVMQDYDAETWSFKHQINLSVVDPDVTTMCPRMVVLNEGELLIQFARSHVLRYNMDGKFLGYVKSGEGQEINLWVTKHYLQESVMPLSLIHETREEDEPPFFVGL